MSIILITGAGKRLGRGLAIEFAKQNYDVIIHYNSSKNLAEKTYNEIIALGRKCVLFKADLRNTKEMEDGFKNITEKFAYPDVLVNNAAIYPQENNLNDTSIELWNDVINTNLTSYFAMSRIFAENAKTGSRIINIASLGAFKIFKGRIPYNVSKAGVIQLTKALALELAPNITVNSVSPGSIFIDDVEPSEKLAITTDRIPMKRYGTVKDVFDAVKFFANSSNYITGQNLCVDGGFNLK